MKHGIKLLALLLCGSLLLSLLPLRAAAKEDPDIAAYRKGRIIVSLGDSYASGEGVPAFYGQNEAMQDRCRNEDWLAHRSTKAWGGRLRLPAVQGSMAENRGTNWFFAASSGATTDHIRRTGAEVVDRETGRKEGQQTKEYDRGGYSGSYNLPGQLDVFYDNPDLDRYEVDYVTLSIGGNDVGFKDVLTEAALSSVFSSAVYDAIDEKLEHFYDRGSTYYQLRDAYRRIAEAAPNATILVTGYPELLDYNGKGTLFNRYEARYINSAVSVFNARISALIRECREDGMRIEFVSVEEAFRGHQAYSDDPYLNEIFIGPRDQDLKTWTLVSDYSMHPNERGIEAYVRCVQNKIDELEAKKAQNKPARELSGERNVVLVLDNSGSMDGAPIRQTRKAARNFIDTVLAEDASVGVVTFNSEAVLCSEFNQSAVYLKDTVDSIRTGGRTNTEAGLRMAAGMLDEADKGKKIIVLMSDGLANQGLTGEELLDYARSLKDQGIYIYTLGFFQDLSGSELSKGQNLLERMANPGCHYEVEDADHLVAFFNDIADQINGQNYVYIRIACPVDVEVTCGGEVLSSLTGNTRTSFGTMTFEAGEGSSYSSDNRTKILRLREDGTDYQIRIRGNGEGTMHFTAGFMDENGEYSDLREIRDVPITSLTRIDANADRDEATVLRVDEDGDGDYDRSYREGGPPSRWWIFVLAGGVLAVAVLVFLLLRRRKHSGRRQARASGGMGVLDAAAFIERPGPVPAAAGPAAALVCRSCGRRQSGSSQFCAFCGAPLSPAPAAQPKYCPNCGTGAAADTAFCPNCGTRL